VQQAMWDPFVQGKAIINSKLKKGWKNHESINTIKKKNAGISCRTNHVCAFINDASTTTATATGRRLSQRQHR
jgi:hypothetical protein